MNIASPDYVAFVMKYGRAFDTKGNQTMALLRGNIATDEGPRPQDLNRGSRGNNNASARAAVPYTGKQGQGRPGHETPTRADGVEEHDKVRGYDQENNYLDLVEHLQKCGLEDDQVNEAVMHARHANGEDDEEDGEAKLRSMGAEGGEPDAHDEEYRSDEDDEIDLPDQSRTKAEPGLLDLEEADPADTWRRGGGDGRRLRGGRDAPPPFKGKPQVGKGPRTGMDNRIHVGHIRVDDGYGTSLSESRMRRREQQDTLRRQQVIRGTLKKAAKQAHDSKPKKTVVAKGGLFDSFGSKVGFA